MKKFIIAVLLVMLTVGLCGCGSSSGSSFNYQLFDTTYAFDHAYIHLPNGETIEGNVDSWRDYEDGDQIQVTIRGKTYLTHSSQVVLIANGR